MSATSVAVFQSEIETVTEFLQRFKVQNASALEAAPDDTKRAEILCRALPVAIITDVQRRIKPTLLERATYQQIEDSLNAQFSVKKSIIGASVKFINRKQLAGETIETYAKILNDLASCCSYNDCCRDRLLRDAFVSGLSSNKLLSSLLHECENKSFNDCVERAKTLDQLAHDAADMKPEATSSSFKIVNSADGSKKFSSTVSANYTCIRCGTRGKHKASNCFAIKLACKACSKMGHLAKVCRTKNSRVNAVSEETENIATQDLNFAAARRQPQPSSASPCNAKHCCNDATSRCNYNTNFATNNDSSDHDSFLW